MGIKDKTSWNTSEPSNLKHPTPDKFISCVLEIFEPSDEAEEKSANETELTTELEINACMEESFISQTYDETRKVWSNCTVDAEADQIECCGP